MCAELVFAERTSERQLSIEIPSDLMSQLQTEYARRRAESNPGTITFDAFLQIIIDVGLERLLGVTAEEALVLVEEDLDLLE